MKTRALILATTLLSACASSPTSPTKVALHDENDKLCENHKTDYRYFNESFNKERAALCSNGCTYTASMNKNSDTMERIAGTYYLMNCDYVHGRL